MTDHVEVPLSQGLVALIDAADAEAVLAHKWSAERDGKTFYAMRNVRQPTGGWRKIKLHAYLTGHRLTDHINGDGLDNRRANLRMATQAENLRNRGLPANNTSGFKGVSFRRQRGAWMEIDHRAQRQEDPSRSIQHARSRSASIRCRCPRTLRRVRLAQLPSTQQH